MPPLPAQLRTATPSLALLLLAAPPLVAQSTESVSSDSAAGRVVPLTAAVSAPARSIGSVRYSVDSSAATSGARPRTISELLQARVPGVSVLRYGGDASDGSRIRVRGAVSLFGDAAPIVVVDGIRVNAPDRLGGSQLGSGSSMTSASRFDDFAPEEIERVDVLSGPAATTLFGAGASNGAIVITTKRGASGGAQVSAWSAGAMTSEPTAYPANYRQLGTHPVTGTPTAICGVVDIAEGRCTPTTLQVWNPLEEASPFRHGQYRAGGASVSGGPFGIRAFASGSARTETSVLDDSRGSRLNGRLNVERALFDGFVIGGNVGYVDREATLRTDPVVERGLFGLPVDDEVNRGYRAAVAAPTVDRGGDRLSRSARLDWQVRPWLRVHGLGGRDELTQRDRQLNPGSGPGGTEWAARSWQGASLVHGTAEASYRVAPLLRLQTLLSYEEMAARTDDEELLRSAEDGRVWRSARFKSWRSIRSWMLQERIDLSGALFVNVGVRRIAQELSDGRPGWHPSVDAAWDAGRVGGAALRLRGAYAVGVPTRLSAGLLGVVPGIPGGTGPAPIDPERPREAELGIDARWGSRIDVRATYVDQQTPKFIAAEYTPYPWMGPGPVLGRMANRGVELGVRAALLDRPDSRWTAGVTVSALRNRVTGLDQPPAIGGPGVFDNQPFGTVMRAGYTFVDADGNGLPDRSEILPADVVAAGTVIPTREGSLRSELELRRWGVTVAAALDHRGGHRAYDMAEYWRCAFQQCRGWQDPGAPLAEKVRAVAAQRWGPRGAQFLEDASYTRLGELSLAWRLPERVGRAFGNALTLVVEGRNVATWTRFPGADPEVATALAMRAATQSLPLLPAVPRTVGVRVEWR